MASKPIFPVYIISKGRAYNPMTAKLFEKAGIDYLIAVEPQEAEEYTRALSKQRILILPFSNLRLGSYPARNVCWEHAKKRGYKYHWLFDDNIQCFKKWINGRKKTWEDITTALIYVEQNAIKTNVDISGFEEPNWETRVPKKPFQYNTHVYSSMLIKNNLPYRWRLKYNEDVDLCLQVLHNGGTSSSCIYYMADKVSTSNKMKGGNQDELYKGNDQKKNQLKAETLKMQWPQYTKIVIKFGRIHHHVDWKLFKNNNKD